MKAQGENRLLSLVALDNKARKFTNCTSVRPAFELRGDTFVSLADDSESAATRYGQIKHYVATATNYDLLTLRQRFDEQPEVIFRDQLVGDGDHALPSRDNPEPRGEALYTHHFADRFVPDADFKRSLSIPNLIPV